jgi:predicted metal-dependent peptidase
MPGEWDKHEFMDGEANKEEMENALADVFVRAKESMPSYSEIPGYVQDLLNQFNNNRAEINYRELLNKAFRKSLPQRDRTYTWKRPNKRWGYVAPGTKIDSVPKIEIFADTSGSITYEVLNVMLGVIDGFVNEANSEIKLHLFHTEHYHTQSYRKSTKFKEDQLQSGGTDLNQVTTYIEKHPMDLAIILTDGYYGEVTTKKLPTKTLFLIVENGDVNHPLKHLGETFRINNKYHNKEK